MKKNDQEHMLDQLRRSDDNETNAAMDIARPLKKRATKEHVENRSGERNV